MARLHKNGTLSGLMGDVVMRSYNDTTYVYKRPDKVTNPQSHGQMKQRTRKQNIVNLYGKMKPALKDNFQGKTGRQSDYTMFVSSNLSQTPVYLTENEAKNGKTQVVAPYVVAYGKMSPIEYQLEGEWLVSNIQAGSLQLADETMVCSLAASIIGCNEDWKYGDVLELICCHQKSDTPFDSESVPYAECSYANIELDKSDRSSVKKMLDGIVLKVNEDGWLCMHVSAQGGYGMVHKRQSAKGVIVGTQNMVVYNDLLEHYCSEEHCEEAIKSYSHKK